ncbi:MAG: TonB-dependent Receptor Plug Domain protein [Mucilaginibacter sp.]|nr:TonB-dependent Receptor Plug Domain protein [Mucilaginibacter sp.]
MKKLLLFLLVLNFGQRAFCQQQIQKILKGNTLNKFVARPLDDLLDTLSANYNLRIVFERDSVHRFDVVEHFFNEPLNKVLDKVCNQFDLHYWVDAGGIIYVLQNVDDMARLKGLARILKPLERPKRDTVKADTTDEQDIEALYDNKNKPITKAKGEPKQVINIPRKAPGVHLSVTISGRVIDQSTGTPLPSATVHIQNNTLSVTANSDGNFTIFQVPSDTATLDVSYSGYQSEHFKMDADKLSKPLVLGLYPALTTLNEVTILGQKNGVMNTDVKKVGVLQLSPANLDKLPSLGEKDIMRAFQLMPGVGATNESSSGAYVRGGTPDQNLVVFDGFTIYQVDHLYGFFSAFNSNAIKDVQLYKGGFSSQYGGRLSSVTEINGKEGNKNETIYGFDLSLLSLNAFIETPINDKSSLVLAIRRSYQGPFYDKIFKQFNTSTASGFGGGGSGRPGGGGFGEQTTPASHFYDADIRYTYHLNPESILSWSFYSGSDKTDNSRQLQLPSFLGSGSAPSITDYTTYGNLGSSLKWFRQWNKEIHSNTYLTYSSYFNDRNRGTTGTTTDSNGDATSFSNGTVESNNLKDIGFKSEWEWQLSNQIKLLYGGFGSRQHINYDYVQNDTTHLISQHNTALSGGGYTELEIDPNNRLHIQPGFRSTWYQPTGKVYLEPRLSASYVINDNYTLKAATGQFYQYMNEVTREDVLNGNRNFWVLSNGSSIPVGMSRHFMGGISYENDLFLLDVEGYYKVLSGLTQFTIAQTGVGPGGGSQSVDENFYTGSGRTEGIEILLQKKLGRYTGWVSYTLADAENKFAVYGNQYYPADQDIRHEFKAINMYHSNRWNFSAVFIFSTGHPYTAPLSTYSITDAGGNRSTYFNVSAKNAERLPDYHRLDLSATYDLLKINGNKIGSIGLSLFNVYNHVNTWYREYFIQNNAVVITDVNYLGFTPNITFSLRWK